MIASIKMGLVRVLSPKALFWVRSVKRAVMGQSPLPPLAQPSKWEAPSWGEDGTAAAPPRKKKVPTDSALEKGQPLLQDIALERLKVRQNQRAVSVFQSPTMSSFSRRKRLPRTLTLSVTYLNSVHVVGGHCRIWHDGRIYGSHLGRRHGFSIRSANLSPIEARRVILFRKLHLFDSFEGLPEITDEVDLASPPCHDRFLVERRGAKSSLLPSCGRWSKPSFRRNASSFTRAGLRTPSRSCRPIPALR